MGIQIGSGFTLQAGLPLDERLVCVSIKDRDAIPSYQRYQGMTVFVQEIGQNFQLVSGIENIHWENTKAEIENGRVHIGPNAPDESYVWIDLSTETIGYNIPDYLVIFEEFREAIKVLRQENDTLKREMTALQEKVQDIIDNGVIVPPGDSDSNDDYFLTEDGHVLVLEDGGYLLSEESSTSNQDGPLTE